MQIKRRARSSVQGALRAASIDPVTAPASVLLIGSSQLPVSFSGKWKRQTRQTLKLLLAHYYKQIGTELGLTHVCPIELTWFNESIRRVIRRLCMWLSTASPEDA